MPRKKSHTLRDSDEVVFEPKVSEAPDFSVMLRLNEEVQTVTGKNLVAALGELQRPVFIKTKGHFYISNGEKEAVHSFSIPLMKNFFSNVITRHIWAKRFKISIGQ